MIKVLLLTSGQPAANPRLVKESIFLCNQGYDVSVLYCPISTWADANDKILFQSQSRINWIKVAPGLNDNKFYYLLIRFKCWVNRKFFILFGDRFNFAENSYSIYGRNLKKEAKKYKVDYYIGHNLGALPAVIIASRKNGGKAVFDFEDFHRGEDEVDSLNGRIVKCIENKYISSLDHASGASPLIVEQYKNLYPNIKFTVINNCFSLSYKKNTLGILSASPLKLFWFSQHIGKNRGIETIISAMACLRNYEIELTLLGNLSNGDRDYFMSEMKNAGLAESKLIFKNPVEEKEITGLASLHHIGLALDPGITRNRDYCLTNKIFIYLLSSNAILYSNTEAHRKFFYDNKDTGFILPSTIEKIAEILKRYIADPNLLHQHRYNSLIASDRNNWEQESHKVFEYIR